MADLMFRVVGLGIAGIDPIGAMILFSAISAGASRAKTVAYTASVLVVTVLLGVALTVFGGQLIENTLDRSGRDPGAAWAILEVAFAILITVWLVRRLVGRAALAEHPEKQKKPISGSAVAFVAGGTGFALTAILDPTFVLTAAVLAQGTDDVATIAVAFAVWTLISQFMLFALLAANLAGVDARLVEAVRGFWARHHRPLENALYVAAALLIAFLVADVAVYFLDDRYLVG